MWQMYDSLIKYIESSNIKDKVQIKFIDVINDNIKDYPTALNLLRKGYALPLVIVNGVAKFYGSLPYEAIYIEIEKCL